MPDRKRIARYGCSDFEIKVYDLVLKCHKIVYSLAQNEQDASSDNLLSSCKEPFLCNQMDLTYEVSKYYAPKKDVPVR